MKPIQDGQFVKCSKICWFDMELGLNHNQILVFLEDPYTEIERQIFAPKPPSEAVPLRYPRINCYLWTWNYLILSSAKPLLFPWPPWSEIPPWPLQCLEYGCWFSWACRVHLPGLVCPPHACVRHVSRPVAARANPLICSARGDYV